MAERLDKHILKNGMVLLGEPEMTTLRFLAPIFEPQGLGRIVVLETTFFGHKGRFPNSVPKRVIACEVFH